MSDAGFLVLAILERSAAQDDGTAKAPFAEVARRFGISRTHVRKVLEAGAAAGLLEIRAPGDRAVALNDRLQHGLDRFFADLMSVTDHIYAIATGRE
jgi:DNA-binding FadR family transcriptional regulator